MKFFLIVFDRKARRILDLQEFTASQHRKALDALFEREMQERLDPNLEVVLLAAESEEALRHTHRRYFFRDDIEELTV
jgi:hypothetical protein